MGGVRKEARRAPLRFRSFALRGLSSGSIPSLPVHPLVTSSPPNRHQGGTFGGPDGGLAGDPDLKKSLHESGGSRQDPARFCRNARDKPSRPACPASCGQCGGLPPANHGIPRPCQARTQPRHRWVTVPPGSMVTQRLESSPIGRTHHELVFVIPGTSASEPRKQLLADAREPPHAASRRGCWAWTPGDSSDSSAARHQVI